MEKVVMIKTHFPVIILNEENANLIRKFLKEGRLEVLHSLKMDKIRS